MPDILKDFPVNGGRERPWRKHKKNNEDVVRILRYMKEIDRAHKIENCANVLEFGECPNNHGKWLKRAFFCKDRFCSMCAWRKSLFVYHQFIQVAHQVLAVHPDYDFLMFTKTLKNCAPEDLGKTVTHYHQSSDRMMKYAPVKRAFKGSFRTIETTYNPLTKTVHPHVHEIIAVQASYFKSRDYLSQKALIGYWKKAAQIDYDPSVHIERIKPKKKGVPTIQEAIQNMDRTLVEKHDALAAAGGEVAKYSVKVRDIVNPPLSLKGGEALYRANLALRDDLDWQAEVLNYLMRGLHRRRLIVYSGVMRDAYQQMNCQDVEKSDLILMPGEEKICKCKICQSELIQVPYIWSGENYMKRRKDDN